MCISVAIYAIGLRGDVCLPEFRNWNFDATSLLCSGSSWRLILDVCFPVAWRESVVYDSEGLLVLLILLLFRVMEC